MTILDEIFEKRSIDIESVEKSVYKLKQKPNSIKNIPKNRKSLYDILEHSRDVKIISELKVSSPTADKMYEINTKLNFDDVLLPTVHDFLPIERMMTGGTSAFSVLTEPRYFTGSFGNLLQASAIIPPNYPVLLKDFIISKYQLELGKMCGASNALVIAKYPQFKEILHMCCSVGIEPLIEIHDEEDLQKIAFLSNRKSNILDNCMLNAGDDKFPVKFVIGINNRNLNTMKIDLQTTSDIFHKVQAIFGANQPIITESGISTEEDILMMKEIGIQGALIGSAVMRSNISTKIREFALNRIPYTKLCGIRSDYDLNVALSAGFNAIGVIYKVPSSPRNLNADEIINIFNNCPPSLLKVLVMKDLSIDEILNAIKRMKPDFIQYHGNNIREIVNIFRLKYPAYLSRIIFPVKLEEFDRQVPYFKDFQSEMGKSALPFAIHLDSSEGKGKTIDLPQVIHILQIMNDLPISRIILAGGLSPKNIKSIISSIHGKQVFGVDVSSSIEINNQKDLDLAKQFISNLELGLKQ